MAIVWFVVQVVYAILAAFGLFVLVAFGWIEGVPRFRLWSADVREGYDHYLTVRRERRLEAGLINAAGRSQETIELAKERMAAALRSRS